MIQILSTRPRLCIQAPAPTARVGNALVGAPMGYQVLSPASAMTIGGAAGLGAGWLLHTSTLVAVLLGAIGVGAGYLAATPPNQYPWAKASASPSQSHLA